MVPGSLRAPYPLRESQKQELHLGGYESDHPGLHQGVSTLLGLFVNTQLTIFRRRRCRCGCPLRLCSTRPRPLRSRQGLVDRWRTSYGRLLGMIRCIWRSSGIWWWRNRSPVLKDWTCGLRCWTRSVPISLWWSRRRSTVWRRPPSNRRRYYHPREILGCLMQTGIWIRRRRSPCERFLSSRWRRSYTRRWCCAFRWRWNRRSTLSTNRRGPGWWRSSGNRTLVIER